jgi:hypothetical protein
MLMESCLIQDEPKGGNGFSHKMSLEERSRMLGIDHPHASTREDEPGADPGVFGSANRAKRLYRQIDSQKRLGAIETILRGLQRRFPEVTIHA